MSFVSSLLPGRFIKLNFIWKMLSIRSCCNYSNNLKMKFYCPDFLMLFYFDLFCLVLFFLFYFICFLHFALHLSFFAKYFFFSVWEVFLFDEAFYGCPLKEAHQANVVLFKVNGKSNKSLKCWKVISQIAYKTFKLTRMIRHPFLSQCTPRFHF